MRRRAVRVGDDTIELGAHYRIRGDTSEQASMRNGREGRGVMETCDVKRTRRAGRGECFQQYLRAVWRRTSVPIHARAVEPQTSDVGETSGETGEEHEAPRDAAKVPGRRSSRKHMRSPGVSGGGTESEQGRIQRSAGRGGGGRVTARGLQLRTATATPPPPAAAAPRFPVTLPARG